MDLSNSLKASTAASVPLLKISKKQRNLVNFCPLVKSLAVYSFDLKPLDAEEETVPLERLIFSFQLNHVKDGQKYEWQINRSYQDFQELDSGLTKECKLYHLERPECLPPINSFREIRNISVQQTRLESYLRAITACKHLCQLPSFLEFVEVSALSFDGNSSKRKEGYLYKRTGGRRANENYLCNCAKYFKRFQKRWLMIRDDMVGYITRLEDENLHEALGFKGKFNINYGFESTGFEDGIKLVTNTREFLFRAGNPVAALEWYTAINTAYQESQWYSVDGNRYNSSFPVRLGNSARWYIDGEDYFRDVCDELLKAKAIVYITDWWLSPELLLKRPSTQFPHSSVAEVLGTIADRGVKVYVHVYKEVALALTTNSLHTKQALKLSSNKIRIVRHPHRSVVGRQFLWTHHEKAVVIDHALAFIGGLDLCFGRWDNAQHLLSDPTNETWPGIDYSNCRISDFSNVQNPGIDSIDRNSVPRMPWHDVALQVRGSIAYDIALHFTELWNHVMTDLSGNYYKKKELLQPATPTARLKPQLTRLLVVSEDAGEERLTEEQSPYSEGAGDEEIKTKESFAQESKSRLSRSHSQISRLQVIRLSLSAHDLKRHMTSSASSRINVEKLIHIDDKNVPTAAIPIMDAEISSEQKALVHDISHRQVPVPNSLERKITGFLGDQVEDQYVQQVRQMLCPQPNVLPMLSKQGSTDNMELLEDEEEKKEKHEVMQDTDQGDEQFARNLLKPRSQEDRGYGACECQLVVSSSLWSYGYEIFENTIYSAYVHLISEATNFIFIENQFFISSTAGELVQNSIAQALVDRIKWAARNQEDFKVIVVLPLLPAFEGSVADPAAVVLRVQLYWEYQTISRGLNSIYQQLAREPEIDDPKKYISFYGLRTHGYMNDGNPATEIVYVHSKLMIVDDKYVIMGSANINDRSMLGNRDSEIGVRDNQLVIEDHKKLPSRIAGKDVLVSEFAYSLRMRLFQEHSGQPNEDILRDPFSEEFDQCWRVRAEVRVR